MTSDLTVEQQRAVVLARARKRKAMSTQNTSLGGQKDQGYIPENKGIKDYLRTGLDQGMQGATFGFSDEVSDRVGALIASQFTGLPYSDLLKEARSTTKTRLEEQFQEMPITSIAANIAGGVLTGGAGATTKTGAAVGNSLRTGSTAARIGKGAAAGAASGATYGAGSAVEGERIEGAGQGAVLGGVLGAAVPAVAAAGSGAVKGAGVVKTGLAARGADELEATAQKIKYGASKLYQQSREAGAILNSRRAVNIINRMERAILSSGKLNDRLHGDTLSVLGDIKEAVKSPLSLEELDQFRQLLGDVVSKNTDAIKGMNPDALKASQAMKTLDNAVESLVPIDIVGGDTTAIEALKAGREQWTKFRKFESVSNIIRQADGDPNKIKAGFKRFVNKPKNLRGFTEEEIKTLKAASINTINEKILKGLGRFGFEPGNVFLPIVGGTIAGGGLGAPAGVALTAAGTVARQAQKYTARGKAEQAARMIEGGQTKRIEGSAKKKITKTMDVQTEKFLQKLKEKQ